MLWSGLAVALWIQLVKELHCFSNKYPKKTNHEEKLAI